MSKMHLGEKIRTLRKSAGLRQEDLCAKAGVSVRVIKDIESGVGNPTIDNLSLILSVLGVDLYDLISLDGITIQKPVEPTKDEILAELESIKSMLTPANPSVDMADYERLKAIEAHVIEVGGPDLWEVIKTLNVISAEGLRIGAELPSLPVKPRRHAAPPSQAPAQAPRAKKPTG